MEQKRCRWCQGDALLLKYHDEEWGVFPLHQERDLFEMLTLEIHAVRPFLEDGAAQAGGHVRRFRQFRSRENRRLWAAGIGTLPERAGGDSQPGQDFRHDQQRPLLSENRGGIRLLRRVPLGLYRGQSPPGGRANRAAQTPLSEKISADLRRRGFKYTGPVVIYSYLQAVGMVNDHEKDCYLFSPPAQNAARR